MAVRRVIAKQIRVLVLPVVGNVDLSVMVDTITTANIVVNELLLAKVECIMTKNNPYFFGTISLLKV